MSHCLNSVRVPQDLTPSTGLPKKVFPLSVLHSYRQVLVGEKTDFELDDMWVSQHTVVNDLAHDIFVQRVFVPWYELDCHSGTASNILAAPDEAARSSVEFSHQLKLLTPVGACQRVTSILLVV